MNSKSAVLTSMAEFYGEPLTETRLKMYLQILKPFSLAEVKAGCQKCMENSKIYRMPLPAVMIEAIRGQRDPKDMALESLDRIRNAIRVYGWQQSEKAKEYLSDDEWSFVCRRGGWQRLCSDRENNLNDTSVYAQMRDSLTTQYRNIQAGHGHAELPSGDSQKLNTLVRGALHGKSMDD